eukprot:CAMPEP_0202476150 /NCGR_PEP_ID=MMETSP1360-20130828/93274_1 /ASSEMBLY_ACC=CAM_ASM_000848 /TAXON_ID=515479 /ORGANISM="Licmophora paradoxa, Strain CCMP2313" /LENGTH=507 /DNA_ID=CAMNT_0049103349 /DNA_START=56 /DNA_END=1579 /DNA_ORIENTATION=+
MSSSHRMATTESTDNSQDNQENLGDLFVVSSYSNFEKLAHGPRGTEARHSLSVYLFNPSDGSMILQNKLGDPKEVINPAFSRFHPRLNVVYTCTEDIENAGRIFAYNIQPNGELRELGSVDAGGTSTCYLTIDKEQKHMLAVNYWNSTLAVLPLDQETGAFKGPIQNIYDPKHGKAMVAAMKKNGGVNHSHNDESTIKQRQADPHSHALVLDPFVGTVAYVPDLGKDLIREFYYDRRRGAIDLELNMMPSGLSTGMPDGPRYFEFHPSYNVAYAVNELSSTIAIFCVDRKLLNEISKAANNGESMDRFKGRSTLTLMQSIQTIPSAFPTKLNTCGRICVHKSGRFVIVSNRGHESIAVFRVIAKGKKKGQLVSVGHFHTRGETPRHFQFDSSGQYLIVANQDTDTIAVFTFNLCSGEIMYTGNEYRVPSPNFVCSCPIYDHDLPVPSTVDQSLIESVTVESDLEESSDESTMEVYNNKLPKNLASELAIAQKEIEELKQRLAAVIHV